MYATVDRSTHEKRQLRRPSSSCARRVASSPRRSARLSTPRRRALSSSRDGSASASEPQDSFEDSFVEADSDSGEDEASYRPGLPRRTASARRGLHSVNEQESEDSTGSVHRDAQDGDADESGDEEMADVCTSRRPQAAYERNDRELCEDVTAEEADVDEIEDTEEEELAVGSKRPAASTRQGE